MNEEHEHHEPNRIEIVSNSSDKRFYELLNCVPSSSLSQIKAEYRELALAFRTVGEFLPFVVFSSDSRIIRLITFLQILTKLTMVVRKWRS
jgi:hypothetical protein